MIDHRWYCLDCSRCLKSIFNAIQAANKALRRCFNDYVCMQSQYIIKLSIESYQLKGYNLVTYNLSKRGLCIFAKPNLTLNVLEEKYFFDEYVLCGFIGSQRNMLICCIYRSPSSSIENDKKLFKIY